ncbi:MAG: MFS transporter [Pyrinomonadaceae bacterium]|nr:MFS transporter [Pyrinomonadaceae bacterium]
MLSKTKRFLGRYRKLTGNVFALSVVSFLNDTSSEIIYPLLPTFLALTMGATPFVIGLIEGFAESVASLLKLFSGHLSDKFGNRKLPVFAGYSLASILRPLLAFAVTWQHVLILRVGDRVGKGIRVAPRDALLAESVSEDDRGLAFGFNRAADHLGAVFGPMVAFILLYFLSVDHSNPTADEYRQVFLFAAVPIVLGLFVVIFFVKEEKTVHPDGVELESFSLAGFDSNFKRFLIILVIFTLSNSTDAFLLLRAQEAGVSLVFLPLLWMGLHLSKVLSSLVFGDLSDRLGRRRIIFGGWMLYALVYLGFAFANGPYQVLALFLLYGVFFGMTEGVEKALVADLVPKDKKGTAYGLYNLAFGIAVFPASLIFGALWYGFSASTAFLVSSGISITAAILILTVRNPKFDGDSRDNVNT